jgi:hypothetical protein
VFFVNFSKALARLLLLMFRVFAPYHIRKQRLNFLSILASDRFNSKRSPKVNKSQKHDKPSVTAIDNDL